MKPHAIAAIAAILAIAAPSSLAANGPLKDKATALAKSNKDSVLWITALLDLEFSAGDNPPQKEEKKVETIGTVLNKDGLIVVPLSALDVSAAMDGRTVPTQKGPMKLAVKSEIKEVKIIMPDGTEVAAKVDLKDADLDIAFLRPEKAGSEFTPVNTQDSAPLAVLDDLIILGRLGKDLNREPFTATSEIISVITKPRTFGKTSSGFTGMPMFNGDGKFVGIGVNRFSSKNGGEAQPSATAVILPTADLLESAAQVK